MNHIHFCESLTLSYYDLVGNIDSAVEIANKVTDEFLTVQTQAFKLRILEHLVMISKKDLKEVNEFVEHIFYQSES